MVKTKKPRTKKTKSRSEKNTQERYSIDLNMHDKIKYIFVETHERFSHKLGLKTAKLKLRIKNLNIKNINLDWV